jgi:hypothetical protein
VIRGGVSAYRLGRIGQGAVRLGATAGLTQAGTEAGLQATQITRPVSESAINVAGATVFGATLGAVTGAFGR